MSKKKRQLRTVSAAPKKPQIAYVARPFAGLAQEEDLVAMMQIIPAATIWVRLNADHGSAKVQLVTALPDLVPALKRADEVVLVALQTTIHSGDASRDVAAALLSALNLQPGIPLEANRLPEPGERLQDILDPSFTPEITLHETFDFWLDDENAKKPKLVKELERAKKEIIETKAVPGVEHAYWCRIGGKEFVRWVRGEDEDDFFNAFARIYADRDANLGESGRFVGAFRACGLAIPVWELTAGVQLEALGAAMQQMKQRLEAALAIKEPLDAAARRAKAGIISRQVNL